MYDDAPGCDGSPGACRPCDYVYDPAKGDPDKGIAPGTAFEDLPQDWTCPVCGECKDEFRKDK
ncbi:rubredoxin [Desulfobacter sp.]|uniref:rubredoxin n=1 Tax=Desulfobacter sp. TaxID=2294 RepID=UPI000694CA57|nr:rubredoxin [Desulfobacter sp.]MBP8829129.1 rubredoxin [Desulfobacter sp.]HBT87417.1 rubredoxin [Desulfobacter sp.]